MFGDFGGGFGGFFGGLGSTYVPGQENGFQRIGDFFNNSTAVPPVAQANAPVMAPGIVSATQPVASNTINQQAASSMGFSGDSPQMMQAVSADQKGMGLLPMFSQPSQAPSASAVPMPQSRPASADAVPALAPVSSAPLSPVPQTTTAADGSKWGDYSQPQWPASGKGADLSGSYAQPGTFSDRFDAVAGNVQSPTTALAPQAAQPAVTADQSPAPMPKPQASAVDNMLPAPLWQQQPGIGQQAAQQPSLLERIGDKISGWIGPEAAQASEVPVAPQQYQPIITGASKQYGIPSDVLTKQLAAENGFNPTGTSSKGATGIAQFKPETARDLGVNPNDPNSAIPGAAKYDAQLLDRYGGNMAHALAAYNWGPANVDNWIKAGGDPSKLPAETQGYVSKILGPNAFGQKPQQVASNLNIVDNTKEMGVGNSWGELGQVKGLIIHHTGGGTTADDTIHTLQQRNLGAQYVIDRQGQVHQLLPDGARGRQILPGWGAGNGLNNSNTIGVEVIAKDDKDVLPAQVNAAKLLAARLGQKYGFDPAKETWGHGQVNPGHKEADEGMTIARAIRGGGAPAMMVAKNAPAGQPAQAAPKVASAATPQTGPAAAKAWQPPDLGLTKVASAAATTQPAAQPGLGYRTNPGFAMAQTFAKAAQNVQKAPAIPQGKRAQAPQYDAAHDPVLQALNAEGARYLPMPVAS